MSYKTENPSGRPVDLSLTWFSKYHVHPINRLIHYLSIPIGTFAALGLIWAIPFPHLGFLGKYNGFVNWASFAIAAFVYYYYSLSRVASYLLLLLICAFSAGIVGLEKLQSLEGYPPVWVVCLGLLVLSQGAQFAGHRIEGKIPPPAYSMTSFLIGPLWLFHFFFKKAGIPY